MRNTFFADQGQDIFVKDIAFTISQFFEPTKSGIGFGFAVEFDAQVLQALLEGIAPTQLAQHDFVGTPAYILCPHDFVGITRFQNTILVNT